MFKKGELHPRHFFADKKKIYVLLLKDGTALIEIS